MTTALFQYLHASNTPIGSRLFTKLTEPGPGDPAITRLGFDIRQSIGGVDTYTYTAIAGKQPVTLAWLNVSAADGMTIQMSYNGRRQVTAADLPGIVADLVTGRPELNHPTRALQALAELADEELFVHAVDNDPDEIPFDGRPIPYEDGGADDYGLQPEW